MANITPPKYVKQVLVTLRSRGHLSYLVGGCVRDMLLERRPNDWDICTSALPDEVMDIFPGAVPSGISHGTVTVKVGSRSLEVTTFREEFDYADHRHPDSVSFVCDLNVDLRRRDFTMNAIALPPEGFMVDPFGGIGDVEKKRIRCVGEPERRFEEDALRMLRAVRFSAKLGFEIEQATLAAIYKKAHLASFLAPERIREEVERTLLTERPEKLFDMAQTGLLDDFLAKRIEMPEKAAGIALLPKKALPRWTAAAFLLEEGGAVSSAEELLLALRLDSRTVRCASDACDLLKKPLPETGADWKRVLNQFGTDTVLCYAACSDALECTGCAKKLKAVLRSGECYSIKHLAISGDELLALGLTGRQLGDMLAFLLDYVIEHPKYNRRDLLLSLAGGTEEN